MTRLTVLLTNPIGREGMDMHVGGLPQESMRRLSIGSAQEVVRLLKGEKPVNFVNPRVWEKHLARMRDLQ